MIAIKDAIQLIRKNGVLTAWTDEQIAISIQQAIEQNALGFNVDVNNKIKSLCFGRWESQDTVYIICMLGRNELKKYMSYLKRTFPRCKYIKATRHGKPIIYTIK